ncbi:spore coat protein [Candidatus Desulfofervidus auxilii]|uniref:Spore coat protein n=1 Tax=Desulfofervidus auxilii TaxID=1621989 RepID=A0A7U4THV2_DESA2|nr:hypothetical protein [Candidatus Desulfofervidus auxilii]AMM40615.1 spore coat protein [Candidatus Desulfofervidus auxilii]
MSLKSPKDIELKELIYHYPFNPYRRYLLLKKEQKKQALYLKIMSFLEKEGEVLKVSHQGKKGLAIVRKLPWDSNFFNVPMGAIEAIFSEKNEESLISAIFDKALSWFKEKGIKHITFKVDTTDTKAILTSQKKSFYLVDTLCTYLYAKNYTEAKPIKQFFELRPFQPKDLEAILKIVEYAFKEHRNRFMNDPYLSKTGMLELYKAWIKNFIKEGYLIVAERKGNIAGFLGYFRLPELCNLTGKLHVGHVLTAVGPKGKGAHAQLIAYLGDAPFYPDTVEGTASISNTIAQNIWIKILRPRIIRTQYVFHYFFDKG